MILTQFQLEVLNKLRKTPEAAFDVAEQAALATLSENGLVDSLWQQPTQRGFRHLMNQIGQLTEGEIEQEIQNKKLINGYRLTPEVIDQFAREAKDYYWHVPGERIYLVYGYLKSEREDLTVQQVKTLADLMKDIKRG